MRENKGEGTILHGEGGVKGKEPQLNWVESKVGKGGMRN